jgi:diaminopimelate epimerase
VGPVRGFFVRVGIPHFVTRVAAIATAPVSVAGPAIRRHAEFGGDGTNVSFIAPREDGSLDIRTYERGVEGETLACGTGCVAAAAVAVDQGWTSSPVTCHTASGVDLSVGLVRTESGFEGLSLAGDARLIYAGRLHPEALTWGRAGDSG